VLSMLDTQQTQQPPASKALRLDSPPEVSAANSSTEALKCRGGSGAKQPSPVGSSAVGAGVALALDPCPNCRSYILPGLRGANCTPPPPPLSTSLG
jgi:hypothetical protein